MMANRYSYGTTETKLIDGMSKEEFIQSKFLTVVLFATVSTVFFYNVLLLGFSFSSYTKLALYSQFRIPVGLFHKISWIFLFLFIF
jgi:hypothetical protein